MNRILFSLATAVALATASTAASAADVLSQDDVAYVLTLVAKDGTETEVEIPPRGDLRPACDGGCRIVMEDGQFVDAKGDDIVHIMDGKIEVYVP